MNCDNALVLIYDLVDGEISPKDQVLLNTHLASCAHCQTTLKSVEKAEKLYKTEMIVNSSVESINSITSQVWQNKNVFSLPAKTPYWSTKRIVYYLGTMAASFAAFIYLAGSLIVVNCISKIDIASVASNIPNNDFHLDVSQIMQAKSGLLTMLTTLNTFVSQSTLLKDLAVILFLASLQFMISYLFAQTKPKQDNKL
jgi:predicted anti-sigma-YlaC factor YlaD